MPQVHDPARREHHVEVEILAQARPHLEREVVQVGRFVAQIVGANDGRVATRVAAAQVALFDHRDVPDPMHLGEVVRGGEPMAATAYDDRVVALLGCRVAPRPLPGLVVAATVLDEREQGVLFHGSGRRWLHVVFHHSSRRSSVRERDIRDCLRASRTPSTVAFEISIRAGRPKAGPPAEYDSPAKAMGSSRRRDE